MFIGFPVWLCLYVQRFATPNFSVYGRTSQRWPSRTSRRRKASGSGDCAIEKRVYCTHRSQEKGPCREAPGWLEVGKTWVRTFVMVSAGRKGMAKQAGFVWIISGALRLGGCPWLVPAFEKLGQVESSPVHVCSIKKVMECILNHCSRKGTDGSPDSVWKLSRDTIYKTIL